MSLQAWRPRRTDGFNAERGFPRRQNDVTRALRWSDVRMYQLGSATFRVLATAIMKRYYGGYS